MKKLIIISILICSIFIGIFSKSFGKEETVEKNENILYTGIVTTNSLNIRSGLSTNNVPIGVLKKDDLVSIYGKLDDWYIIKTENNLIGAASSDYIKITDTVQTSSESEDINKILLSQDEQIFFNLINNKRIENNLPEFEIDENLLNLARLKANDIEKNNYFSHTSPTFRNFF